MSIGVKYVGCVFDGSGYGEAARNAIAALCAAGINVTVSPLTFEKVRVDYGYPGELAKSLVNRDIEYDFVILHATPEQWPGLRTEEKIYIGYVAWETSKIHPSWVRFCNTCAHEIWLPSSNNHQVFYNSGVTTPLRIIPHGIDVDLFSPYGEMAFLPTKTFLSGGKTIVFGSIFRWSERKSPRELLLAYLSEFSPDDNVLLVLKSENINVTNDEKSILKERISHIQKQIDSPLPKICYLSDFLPKQQIAALYRSFDVLVHPAKGEGFGLPIAEAMACGTPVIVSDWGGQIDFVNESNGYIVQTTPAPVSNMDWSPWYKDGGQMWAIPNVDSLRTIMRSIVNDAEALRKKGMAARADIASEYDFLSVGRLMRNALLKHFK